MVRHRPSHNLFSLREQGPLGFTLAVGGKEGPHGDYGGPASQAEVDRTGLYCAMETVTRPR